MCCSCSSVTACDTGDNNHATQSTADFTTDAVRRRASRGHSLGCRRRGDDRDMATIILWWHGPVQQPRTKPTVGRQKEGRTVSEVVQRLRGTQPGRTSIIRTTSLHWYWVWPAKVKNKPRGIHGAGPAAGEWKPRDPGTVPTAFKDASSQCLEVKVGLCSLYIWATPQRTTTETTFLRRWWGHKFSSW